MKILNHAHYNDMSEYIFLPFIPNAPYTKLDITYHMDSQIDCVSGFHRTTLFPRNYSVTKSFPTKRFGALRIHHHHPPTQSHIKLLVPAICPKSTLDHRTW